MSWETEKFEILPLTIEDGDRGKNYPNSKEFSSEGFCLFLNTKNIPKEGFNFNDVAFINKKKDETLRKGKLIRNDIVLTTRGTLGNIGYYSNKIEYENIRINSGMVIIRCDNNYLYSSFLYHQLRSRYFQTQIFNAKSGSAQPQLPIGTLKKLTIHYPKSLQTQKRIAEILSAYDDLIENNLKCIKLLEQAAQNIYKEWFVNLRFPGHESTSINEETGLPEGWEVGVISDFGKVVTGKTPSTKRTDFYGGNIPFIKTPDMHGLPYVIETSDNLSVLGQQAQLNKSLPANSVLVSCIGTAGVVAMTSTISQTNQQINSVVFDSGFKSYYFYCFAKKLKSLLEGLGSSGATMVNVNKGKFENIVLNIPTESLLVEYSKIAEPMFNQMLTLSIQNQKLKAARDILLPRLMNRTIDV